MENTFELPPTKRVRRSDLRSSSSGRTTPDTSSPFPQSPPLETTFDITTFDAPSPPKQTQEEAYEFRLFRSPPSKSAAAADSKANVGLPVIHKISVRSPTPPSELGDGGFLGPGRPLGYYFTAHIAEEVRKEKRERFRVVAVKGDDVKGKGLGSLAWRGCELPWRVTHIRDLKTKSKHITSGPTVSTAPTPETGESTARRKRSGKKRRIAIRTKLKTESAKEEAVKEKRARKNSRKKARKREKNKEKKAGGTSD